MQEKLSCILDVDILYSPNPSLWGLLSGQYKKITVHAYKLPPEKRLEGNYLKDREYRKFFHDWINDVWEKKDKRLAELRDD